MTFAWKDKALRAAGKRGVAKARAYGLATNRRAPISLARVRFLERPVIPASEREKTGKPPAREVAPKMQSSVRSPRERRLTSSVPLRPGERRAQTRVRGRQPKGAAWRGLDRDEHGARLASEGTRNRKEPTVYLVCVCGSRSGIRRD
jgi:hypothetical protein